MKQIYSEQKILVGTLIGGPLAAGYFLWKNFTAFGEHGYANRSLIICIVATGVILGSVLVIPDFGPSSNFLIPLIYVGVLMVLVRRFLSQRIKAHVSAGGRVFGWPNTILGGVFFLALTIIPIVSLSSSFFPMTLDGTTNKRYGKMQHDITFDRGNIPEFEVDRIAAVLTSTGFFDDVLQKSVDVGKSENRYILKIYCNDSIRTNQEAVRYFEDLRNEIQRSFFSNSIVFDLVIGTPDNLIKRLEK